MAPKTKVTTQASERIGFSWAEATLKLAPGAEASTQAGQALLGRVPAQQHCGPGPRLVLLSGHCPQCLAAQMCRPCRTGDQGQLGNRVLCAGPGGGQPSWGCGVPGTAWNSTVAGLGPPLPGTAPSGLGSLPRSAVTGTKEQTGPRRDLWKYSWLPSKPGLHPTSATAGRRSGDKDTLGVRAATGMWHTVSHGQCHVVPHCPAAGLPSTLLGKEGPAQPTRLLHSICTEQASERG